jgi:DNA segregation ATPase FtsK/SpoIIIE, S-DNA-T family
MSFLPTTRMPVPPVEVAALAVERPPELPKSAPANPMTRLLPIAMVVATVGMMALYVRSGAGIARNPAYLLFPLMMLASALGSLAYGARGTGRAELDESRRDYLRYLDEVDDTAARAADAQHRSSCWNHPEPRTLWTLVGTARMWERGPGDPDFGHVRVGIGEQPLCPPLLAPELPAAEKLDPVTADALHRVLSQRSTVAQMPVTVDLMANAVVVVGGEASHARSVVRAVLCQLAVLHDPANVAVAAVVGRSTAPAWDWLKWLPHHRLSSLIDDAGHARMTHSHLHDVAAAPEKHTLVILDGGVVSTPHAPVEGTTVVTVGEAPSALAALATLRIGSGEASESCLDTMTPIQAVVCSRRMARHTELSPAGGRRPPGTWSALTGVDQPDHVDADRLWRPRSDRDRLRVPIGIDDHDDPVELDLKEAAYGGMGPHGLCVGATGSGKSEFLRTLTLGLVATHSPEALNLVLVDFKGGATFLGFERLHHVAAVITNLADEAHLVTRMRDALSGELNRRQEFLRAAGNVANAADYEAVRRRGAALAPLPTLFIVVDEFSELLSQHPDFVDLFVAIGRVGRSLGMHLLLASQRLEEGRLRGLETHLSYRICLKTFSASESRAVLGTVDAFELPNTPGAGYLKTASGDLVRFRTAYVSGPVTTGGSASPRRPTDAAVPFTAVPVGRASTDDHVVGRAPRTVLNAVLDGLAGRGAAAHQVWLPPLATSPRVGELLAQAPPGPALTVPIGLVDNAFEQRRVSFVADLRGAGGNVAVVGGPRSGKSTTLQTLVLGLAATHDPTSVQIYGLDFGGGALWALRGLPHVGAVAGRSDGELIARIVARVQTIVRGRETALRGGRAAGRRADRYGDVFLVVDGWAAARQDFDVLEEAVTTIAAQGLSVHVHVVIAAARWAELRPALKDRLGTRIELRLGDPAESEFDRKRARLLLERPAGHGITRDGLDLVIASPRLDRREVAKGADAWLSAVAAIRSRYPALIAPPVTTLPATVGYDAVIAQSPSDVVLGVGGDEVEPITIDFAATPHALIIGEAQCGKTAALRTLCRELVRTNGSAGAQLVVVDLRRTLLGVVETDHLRAYVMSIAEAQTRLSTVAAELRARLPHGAVTQRQLRERSWWSGPDVYVVVDDYDLVAAAPVNPLVELVDLLPYARDVGLHLVVARSSGGVARAMFDPVLAALRDHGCLGLMMSANPDEGVLFGSVRPSPLPPGRGTVIRRGQPDGHVQVAWADTP